MARQKEAEIHKSKANFTRKAILAKMQTQCRTTMTAGRSVIVLKVTMINRKVKIVQTEISA